MLILLLITVSSLTLGTAEDKLIDDRLSNKQVQNILDKVKNDLNSMQVARDPDQCNYNQIMDEIQSSLEPNLFLHRSVSGQIESPDRFEEVVMSLERGDPEEAIRMCDKIGKGLSYSEDGHLWNEVWVKTAESYLHYLIAEANRKLGNHNNALHHVIEATFVRQTAKGISVNELEKLNGLIALQRLAKFNQDVNELGTGGLEDCQSDSDDCYANENTTGQQYPYHKVSNKINSQDFDGQCVASQVVNSSLGQFERNLRVLGLISDRTNSIIVDELTSVQVDILEQLLVERNVQELLDTYRSGASFDANELWQQLRRLNFDPNLFRFHPNSDDERQRWTNTFIEYYKAEVYRRSSNCIRLLSSEVMLDRVKRSRQVHNGLSLKKILELEGKIVLKSMVCLIKRIETIYQLNGQESEQRRTSKRSILGGNESLLPQLVSKKLRQDLVELTGGSN